MPEEKNQNELSPSQARRKNTLWVDPRQFKEDNVGVNMSKHLDEYGINRFLTRYYVPLLIFTVILILGIGGYVISKLI